MTWDVNRKWVEVLPFSIGLLLCPIAFILVEKPVGVWAFLFVVALTFSATFIRITYRRSSLAAWIVFLVICCGVAAATWNTTDWQIQLAIACCLSLTIYCCASLVERPTIVDAATIVAVTLLATGSLFDIPNGISLIGMVRADPILTGLKVILCCAFSFLIVSANARNEIGRLYAWPLNVVIALCFVVMAFRTDALFIEATQAHWGYFVGPVQGVREGGLLLRDIPSQYGFLPILLAAKLPFASAWTSFYVFQSALLFVCAWVMFLTLLDLKVPALPAGVAVVALFFLADPRGSIGPSPYPSSSAVRFLWCYVSLFVAVRTFVVRNAGIRTFVLGNTLPWICAVLWSAESAFYVSIITAAPLLMMFRDTSRPIRARIRQVLELVSILFCATIVATATTLAVYSLRFGVVPDIAMLVQYAVGYAGGFGALPLSLTSPIWIFFIVLSLGFSAASVCSSAGANSLGALLAASGCVLGIFSYYLGRAVPDNVTALLPLILLSLLIIIRADRFASTNFVRKSYGQAIIGLAIASTLFAPRSGEAFKAAVRQPMSPADKIEVADASLMAGIAEMGINARSPVSYFGYTGMMPSLGPPAYMTFEVPFLPSPPQSLETPISEAARDKILRRHFCPGVPFGFYVEKLSDTHVKAAEWLAAIEKWYDPVRTFERGGYRIIRFERKPQMTCDR